MASYIGNLVIITNDCGKEMLLLHKPPENEKDKLRKRKRIAMNKWVEPGGGTKETDLSEIHSAQRETREETGLEFPLTAFREVGFLQGFFQKDATEPTWSVHIYMVAAFPGMREIARFDPKEHDGIGWFPTNDLPFDDMISSDREWLLRLLNGEQLNIKIVFDKGDDTKVLSCEIESTRFN